MLQRNEFSIEKVMQVVMRHNKAHEPAQPPKQPLDADNIEITEEVLKHCVLKLARIIQQDDTYLPIFKRLKNELETLRQKKSLKEFARRVANNEIEL